MSDLPFVRRILPFLHCYLSLSKLTSRSFPLIIVSKVKEELVFTFLDKANLSTCKHAWGYLVFHLGKFQHFQCIDYRRAFRRCHLICKVRGNLP